MVYKWYILPIGVLYGTYHLLREQGNSIDQEHRSDYDCKGTNHKGQAAHPVLPRVFKDLLAQGGPLPTKAPNHEVESKVERKRKNKEHLLQ